MKKIFIFLAGTVVGAGIGAGTTFLALKSRFEKKLDDELVTIRDYYDKKLAQYETEESEESETEQEESEDDVYSVGEGLPADKKVNTGKVDYTKSYKSTKKVDPDLRDRIERIKAKEYTAHPTENDSDEGVYEIAFGDDEMTGEPGYGHRSDHDHISMTYYADGGLSVTSWGSMEEIISTLPEEDIENTEDAIRFNVLNCLREMEFDHAAYDQCYIRDCENAVDVAVTRVASLSEIDEL